MKAIDLVRWALKMTEDWTGKLAEDVRDAPLTAPTSRGGNHPLWVMGHLALAEGRLLNVVSGEPNPVEHWEPLFSQGTEPTADAAAYPTFDEVLGTYRELRARTLKVLDELGDEGLGRAPKNVPAGFEEFMNTNGRAMLLITLHQAGHTGQIADVRRSLGRKPLMM